MPSRCVRLRWLVVVCRALASCLVVLVVLVVFYLQRKELEAAVAVRESIHRSRVQAKGGSTDPRALAQARMKVGGAAFGGGGVYPRVMLTSRCVHRPSQPAGNSLTWRGHRRRKSSSCGRSLTGSARAPSRRLPTPATYRLATWTSTRRRGSPSPGLENNTYNTLSSRKI